MTGKIHSRLLIFFTIAAICAPLLTLSGSPIHGMPEAHANQDEPDIQWFKEQMQIDPRFQEPDQGILGMSWIHFLTMIFLILFFFGGLMAHFMRIRKRKQILLALLTERQKKEK